MQHGGVENEEEFAISKQRLEEWLGAFNDETKHLQKNAAELQVFLTKKIMPHKERWFFPGRGGRMTMDNKTTSPLEGMNNVLKHGFGLKVVPQMTLLGSLQTQDKQSDRRMSERQIQAAFRYNSTCTSYRSRTCNHVTPLCESQLNQQISEKDKYVFRVVGPYEIQTKRRKMDQYCQKCNSNDECPKHSVTSPIPTFSRVRSIQFVPLRENHYMVKCSCFYHSTFGCPCRHVLPLMNEIQPRHVHVKHQTKFQPNYKRSDKNFQEEITKEFDRLKNEYRLLMTEQEFQVMIHNARMLEIEDASSHDDYFWNDVGERYHYVTNGLVHSLDLPPFLNDISKCSGGLAVQESFLSPKGNEELKVAYNASSLSLPTTVSQSDNLHDSIKSIMRRCTDIFNACGTPEMEAGLRARAADMLAFAVEGMAKINCKKRDFEGSIVSCSVACDSRKKFLRIRRKNEHVTNSTKKKTKKESLFTMYSVVDKK